MEDINLVDIDLNSFSPDEKRLSFITMFMVMKNLHENNKMVTSFMPQDICYDKQTKLFYFKNVVDITPTVANSKEEAIRKNIIDLSTLAFCSHLKTYDPKNGLLNNSVISKEFDKFKDIFNADDVDYFKNVLVDSYETNVNPEPLYYSDYLLKKEKEKGSGGNSNVLVRASEVGRAMSDPNQEAGFGSQFGLMCMVASTVLFVVGYIVYLLSIF